MLNGQEQGCIVYISSWESLKIHLFSFIFGLWVILKRVVRWGWKSKDFFEQQKRDTPPPCLIDSSLGRHSHVKLNGVKFHYLETRGGRGQPLLLLLHGFPDCWLSWRHQIPVLADHFRVVALDLKGFGDSDKPLGRSSYRIDKLLIELRQFISALGVSSCTVVGHDLGGLLGWYLVHRYPDLVDKFVAISCPHPNVYWDELSRSSTLNSSVVVLYSATYRRNFEPDEPLVETQGSDAECCTVTSRWVKFSQLPYLPEMDALKEDLSIINQYFHHLPKTNSKDNYVEAYKYTFSRKEDWTGPINYYRNLPFSRVHEDGEPVRTPCLLLVGNKDEFVSLESIVKSTEYTDKFVLKIVEGGGHFPHQQLPEVVNRFLLAFLVVVHSPRQEKSQSRGLVNRMFDAVSSTVKYGNQMLDTVQRKKCNDENSLSARALYFGQSPS
uniref:AB hydrolase-1 domain-containing protein n=1 Tax=Timema tahoe TaxID=61484 RepID=A0A7R9FMF5_9NEOP|nr:unnamed protein product [Timema tahoe]